MNSFFLRTKNYLIQTTLGVLLVFFSSNLAVAQVASYTFANSSGTYTAISAGTNTASTNAALIRNDNYPALNIGFTFNYRGTDYTQFGINGNGWIMLGVGTMSASTTPISTGTSNNVISAFGADISGRQNFVVTRTSGSPTLTVTSGNTANIVIGSAIHGTGIPAGATVSSVTATTIVMSANASTGGTGSHARVYSSSTGIRYQTIGTAPNRTLVVQWTEFSRHSTTASNGDRLNFQIRLNETSNTINVVYDLATPTSAGLISTQVGLRGASSSDYNNRTTTTAWSATTAGGANTASCSFNNTVVPASGQTFTWTPPPCMTNVPSAPTVSSVTATAANVSWTAPSSVPSNGYIYAVTTSATPPANGTGTAAAGTGPLSVSLSASTTYYLHVQGFCGGTNYSAWATSAAFTTPCAAITALPHSEAFGTYLPSTCWQEGDAGNLTAGPTTISATASSWVADGFLNSGTTGAAKINLDATGDNDWIISPQITLPASPAYQLKYSVGATQWNGTGALTTAWEADDFVQVLISTTGSTNWTVLTTYNNGNVPSNLGQIDISDLSAYAGQTISIAFRGVEGASDGGADIDFFIDNFIVEEIPTCAPPTALVSSNVAATSATISWTAASPAPSGGYDFYISTSATAPTGGTSPSGSVAAGVLTANVSTGIVANTLHYFWVRSDCGSSQYSAWAGSSTFTTPKIEPTNQPTNFAVGTVTTTAIPLTWTAAVAGSQLPDGYLIQGSSVSLAAIADPGDGTDPANVTVYTSNAANKKQTTGASTSTTSFTGMTQGTMYFYEINSYTNTGTSIDFLTIGAPTLNHATRPNPATSASLVASSGSAATISWTAPTGYNATNHTTLVFVKAASAVTQGTPSSVVSGYTANTSFNSGTAYQNDAAAFCVYNGDATSVSISNLSASTTYHVLIYNVVEAANSNSTCSYSSALIANGTTVKAEPTNQPTNFAVGAVTTTAIPLTWTAAVAGSELPDGYLIQGSSVSLAAIADPVDGTDPANVTVYTSNAANKKQTTGTSTSTTSFTGMTQGTMYFYEINSYTNTGAFIDFKTTGAPTLNHATRPNPATVGSLVASSSTTATISWTAPTGYSAGNHTTLVFVKATSAVTQGTPTSVISGYTANTSFNSGTAYQNDAAAYCVYNGDGTSVSISNLSASTTYHVLIYNVVEAANSNSTCSYSSALVANGTTLCAAITVLPHTEAFGTYLPSSCWQEGDLGDITAGPTTISATASSWVADGFLNSGTTGAAKINLDATGDNDWIISPQFTLPASPAYRLKYSVGATQWNGTGALTTAWEADDFVQVLISTTGSTNWTVLNTYNNGNVPSNLGQIDIFDLSAYAGQTISIAFRGVEGASDGGADIDFFIDNFIIEVLPNCVEPTLLVASSINYTSSTISWTGASGSPVGYEYEVRTSGAAGSGATGLVASGTTTDPTVTANITGLTSATAYTYYVRTDCGSSSYSTWASGTFTTLSCNVPTAVTSSSVATTTATISWTAPVVGSPSGFEWEVRSSGAAGSGATGLAASGSTTSPTVTANVTGLTAATLYSAYVRTNCAVGLNSGWTTAATFTTACNAITSLPWTEGFEGLSSVSTSTYPPCWLETNGTYWLSQNAGSSTYHNARTGTYYVGCDYGGTDQHLWTPGFQLVSGNSYEFSTYFVGDGYAGWTGDLIWNTTQNSSGSTALGASFITSGTTSSTSYAQVTRVFTPASTGTYYFGVRVGSSLAPYNYLSFDDFSLTQLVNCSGAPSAGIAPAATNVCSGGTTTLTVTGATTGSGISYQWEEWNGSAWVNAVGGSGATTGSYTTPALLASVQYRFSVLCTPSSQSASTSGITVTVGTPANDACATAQAITVGGGPLTGSVACAAAGSGGCGGSTSNYDVWYSFSVGSTDDYKISLVPSASFDGLFQLYNGCGGSLVSSPSNSYGALESCIDGPAAGGLEYATYNLTPGTYYIRVYDYNGSGTAYPATTTFTLEVEIPVSACDAPTNIASCGTTINTIVASGTGNWADYYDCSTLTFDLLGKESVFTYTPSVTSSNYTVTLSTLSPSGTGNYINIMYKASSCSSVGTWDCIDEMNNTGTTLPFAMTAGVTYYFLLKPELTTGYTINWKIDCAPTPPVNDECAAAIVLPCNTTALAGTTVASVAETVNTGCTMSQYSVWYSFVGNGFSTTVSSTATFDHEMAVLSGSCGSYTNIACRDAVFSGFAETFTFTPALGVTYYVYIAHKNPNSIVTGTFTISRTCAVNEWTGNAISNDWSTNGNWTSGSVPTSSDVAFIPSSPAGANFPILDEAASVASLTLATGANINVLTGNSLTVSGVLSNYGTINVANGGSLVQPTGGTLAGTGTYNISRTGSSVYDYWSSPITSVSTSTLGNPVYLYNPGTGTADPSDDDFDPGWIATGGAMIAAKGYAAYGAGTQTFSGTVNNGDLGIAVTSHSSPNVSYNLIGNPYPSGVSVSSFLSANSSLLSVGSIYLWDDPGTTTYVSGDYAVRNNLGGTAGGGGNAPSANIGTAQGFKVNVNGNGSIQFTNAMRTATNTSNLFRQLETKLLWLSATSASNRYNQTLVGFVEDGTDGSDWDYDAPKLNSLGGLSLYSYMDGEALAIQGYGLFNQDRVVALGLNSGFQDVVTIRLDSTENMTDENIILEDRHFGVFHDLKLAPFQFQSSDVLYSDRFFLHFSEQVVTGITDTKHDSKMNAFIANDFLQVSANESILGVIQIIDITGKIVLEVPNMNLSPATTKLNVSSLSTGIYSVRFMSETGSLVQKVFK